MTKELEVTKYVFNTYTLLKESEDLKRKSKQPTILKECQNSQVSLLSIETNIKEIYP